MAKATKRAKKEIYGVFDGHELIEIGSRHLVLRAFAYAGEEGELISLARMSPTILKIRKAELKVRQDHMKMPWRKGMRIASPRDWALCIPSPEYDAELDARWNEFVAMQSSHEFA